MKYIVDANVPWLAGTPIDQIQDDQLDCALKCTKFIRNLLSSTSKAKIVLDTDWKILKEYESAFKYSGTQPGLATRFYEWACQCYRSSLDDCIKLHETEPDMFEEYPKDELLATFDPPDRKYIALANAHPDKPPIVEGSDCKWWGIKNALNKNGIRVQFISEKYIKMKYQQKIGL